MRSLIFSFACFCFIFLFSLSKGNLLAQDAPNRLVSNNENHASAPLRIKAEKLIEETPWKEKVGNMDYQLLQRLERIYQFPSGKTLKLNPQVLETELKQEIKEWYNASPDQRAKVLISL